MSMTDPTAILPLELDAPLAEAIAWHCSFEPAEIREAFRDAGGVDRVLIALKLAEEKGLDLATAVRMAREW